MIKLSFLGDIMCDGKMARALELYSSGNDISFDSVFIPVKPMFKNSDYVMSNLETPISYRNEELTNRLYNFCSRIEFAQSVKKMGVDFVSTANNHCLDRNISGLESTIMALDDIGLDHAGTYIQGKKQTPFIKEINGVRVGIISCTYGTNAVANGNYLGIKNRYAVDLIQEQEEWLNRYISKWKYPKYKGHHPLRKINKLYRRITDKYYSVNKGKDWFEKINFDYFRKKRLEKKIKKLRKKGADIIVVYAHVGGQNNCEPAVMTLRAIDWLFGCGCNIVIGNHEHVIHGSDNRIESNQFATYAIGNFLGQAGVTERPYDRLSEYSIVLHTYIDEESKKIDKCTFSVTKTILCDDGKVEVWPVAELIKTDSDKEKLKKECLKAAYIFSGKRFDNIYEEFVL